MTKLNPALVAATLARRLSVGKARLEYREFVQFISDGAQCSLSEADQAAFEQVRRNSPAICF